MPSTQVQTRAEKRDIWEEEVRGLWRTNRGAAITLVYRTQAVDLRHRAASILQNGERAEEVVHEVLLRIMREERVSEPSFRIRGWLIVTTRNRCLNILRDAKKRGYHDMSLLREDYEPAQQLDRLEHLDQEEIVRRAIDALKPHHREIIRARFFSDHSYQEMAQVLEIEPGTVMSRLNRAKQKIERALLATAEP